MSKSVSQSHKISFSEHLDAACLRYLIRTGTSFLETKQALCSYWPPHNYVDTDRAEPVKQSLVSQIFIVFAKNWPGQLTRAPVGYVEAVLSCYPHHVQAEIVRLLSTERHQMKQDLISSSTLPPDILARLETSLADLEQALVANDPLISNHLRNSHSILVAYPETVHLLSDADIARLISAAQIHTKIEIVKATAPKTAKAVAKKASVADF